MNANLPYRRCPRCSSREVQQHVANPRRRCRICSFEWAIADEPTIRLTNELNREARKAEAAHPTDAAVNAAADPTVAPAEWV